MVFNSNNMKVFLDTNIFMEFFEQREKIVTLCPVVETPHTEFVSAINNPAFTDIEDSYQYQCALFNGCTQLVTINARDYRLDDQTEIEILNPRQFIDNYLTNYK